MLKSNAADSSLSLLLIYQKRWSNWIISIEKGDTSSIYLLEEGKSEDERESDRLVIQGQEKFFEQLDKFKIEY